jgi:hypothetical protein
MRTARLAKHSPGGAASRVHRSAGDPLCGLRTRRSLEELGGRAACERKLRGLTPVILEMDLRLEKSRYRVDRVGFAVFAD